MNCAKFLKLVLIKIFQVNETSIKKLNYFFSYVTELCYMLWTLENMLI